MRGGGLRDLSQWVQLFTWSPNKLWRSNSIFNLCVVWIPMYVSPICVHYVRTQKQATHGLNTRHQSKMSASKKMTCKGTLRQVFICLRPPPLRGFCLGWSNNFVGSESAQSVKLLQNMVVNSGRILGWNPDKSLQGFPPCYLQSALQFALRLLFLRTHATSSSFSVQLLYTIKEKGWKTENQNPFPMV